MLCILSRGEEGGPEIHQDESRCSPGFFLMRSSSEFQLILADLIACGDDAKEKRTLDIPNLAEGHPGLRTL